MRNLRLYALLVTALLCGAVGTARAEGLCGRLHRGKGRPVVANVYVPVRGLDFLSESRSDRLAALQAAHLAELQEAAIAANRAAEDEGVRRAQAALERTNRAIAARLSTSKTAAASTDIELQLKDIRTRLDNLERLVIKHDDYLRKVIEAAPKAP